MWCNTEALKLKASTTDTFQLKPHNSDLNKSMELLDNALRYYFSQDYSTMYRFYNPFTQERSREKASVWMYTSAIEAVNSILKSLHQSSSQDLETIKKYKNLLEKLYDNADYYLGTFELTSFTQTNTWSVYAVDRVNEKGKARVSGIYNVYDDQMWLIRELLDSYHLTKNETYLQKAEYLTSYVLDGWDATRDENGKEYGGIPWGPGYVTKHACSNGPMISPLVWLHEIYKGKKDKVFERYIDTKDRKTRKTRSINKKDYYLAYAVKIYEWQKKYLLNDNGVYTDMMGGCDPNCSIVYEEINGEKFRAHTALNKPIGKNFTYNSGTMLSGAVDLYRATKKKVYLEEAKNLAKASFEHFAKPNLQVQNHYTFPHEGFSNWFNIVLLRGYIDLAPFDNSVTPYIEAFHKNIAYSHVNFNYKGLLPSDLLGGWNKDEAKNQVEGMFMFSFATQWALCDQFKKNKK